jgi:hypothetical protein
LAQAGRPVAADTPPHLRALDQGRFDKYLPAFREAFGERCLTIPFDYLKSDPLGVMRRICEFAEIDVAFYDIYNFAAENVSHVVHSGWVMKGYTKFRRGLTLALHDNPVLINLLRIPNRYIKKMLSLNTGPADRVEVAAELADFIHLHTQRDDIERKDTQCLYHAGSKVTR